MSQLAFEICVHRARADDEPSRARARAPTVERVVRGRDHRGMGSEPEVVVRRERHDRAPVGCECALRSFEYEQPWVRRRPACFFIHSRRDACVPSVGDPNDYIREPVAAINLSDGHRRYSARQFNHLRPSKPAVSIPSHPVELVASARRHHYIQVAISVEVSRADEVRLRGYVKNF